MKRNRPHDSADAFDVWLGLVDDLIIEPLIDAGREVRRSLRSRQSSPRGHCRRGSRFGGWRGRQTGAK